MLEDAKNDFRTLVKVKRRRQKTKVKRRRQKTTNTTEWAPTVKEA